MTTEQIIYFASALDFDGSVIARPLQKNRNGDLGKPRIRTEVVGTNSYSTEEE
jgi:hypothetical protein